VSLVNRELGCRAPPRSLFFAASLADAPPRSLLAIMHYRNYRKFLTDISGEGMRKTRDLHRFHALGSVTSRAGLGGGGGAGKCREARDRIHLPTEEPSRPRRFASLFPSPSLITSRSPLLNSILIRFALSRAIMRAFHALARAPRRDNKIDRWRRKTLNAAPHHAAATPYALFVFLDNVPRRRPPPPPQQRNQLNNGKAWESTWGPILCERAQSVSNSEILIEDLAPREYAPRISPPPLPPSLSLSLALSLSLSVSQRLSVRSSRYNERMKKEESKMYMHRRK